MAENPKTPENPSGLAKYEDVRHKTVPAPAETGFWDRVRERFTRAVTGADQLGGDAATTAAQPRKDGVLRWADTGEPYFPQAQKPAPTALKPYVPQARVAEPIPDIQDLPVLTIRAPQHEVEALSTTEAKTYQIQNGDTLGAIAEKQGALRAASGLEGQSSVWAVAIATAKLNNMETISDTIRAGDALQLPSADMVRETAQALSGSIAADGKITWSEAKSVEAQHVGNMPVNPLMVSR